MNSYILIGIESFIDHIGCIRDLGIAYWKIQLYFEKLLFYGLFQKVGNFSK